MTGYGTNEKGGTAKTHGITHSVSSVIYRPYLLEARGYDERTSYHAGTRNYAVGLLGRVLKLKINEHFLKFTHSYHTNKNWSKVPLRQQKSGLDIAEKMISSMSSNFWSTVKNVKNSYW